MGAAFRTPSAGRTAGLMLRELWPFRPAPFADELLSSWIARLAHGHGLRSASFLDIVHPGCADLAALDWTADGELLALLATRTDVPLPAVESLRLRFHPELGFHDLLHHNWHGSALQYCPACLAEGVPYYRKSWRLACFRVCPQHHTALRDQCPHCGSIIRLLELPPGMLALCQKCGHPLIASECMPLSRSECFEKLIAVERRIARALV
jgi:hypothetical protein